MAGAGVRLFTAGQILTAAQVNTYLQDQVVSVFDDAATRDASFGGLGEPSLSEGRVCYLKSDNKLYMNTDGTPTGWIEIGAQVDDGEITTIKLADGSVTVAKLATGAPRAGFNSTQNAQTGTTYSLVLADLGKLVELNNASDITVTIPTNASQAFAIGDRIDLMQTGAGQVTVSPASGVTLTAYDAQYKLSGQWACATLIKRDTNSWVLIGNITS
jgi:hypothetical protein